MNEPIVYNSYVFIGFYEEWKPVTYQDVAGGRYEVSNIGRFRKTSNGKILHGCNPNNERGHYYRISLKSMSGKTKKYQMHRIVLYEFGGHKLDICDETNHIDGHKGNNSYKNLEISNRKDNARHAAVNNLYQNCQRHYKSIFTDNEVHEICGYLEEGLAISEIIDKMNLKSRGAVYSNIDKIASNKTWKQISSQYNIDYNKYHYKTYSYDDIEKMAYKIFVENKTPAAVAKEFPEYDYYRLRIMLKSLKHHRIYKKISGKYQNVQRLSKA